MSRLDDLQTAAQQASQDTDSPMGLIGQLQSENDTAVQEAVAWGNEGGAQILDGPAKQALEEALQQAQGVKDKLDEYTSAVEQAKGSGG